MLDLRRVELIDEGLPSLPHHHTCQGMPLDAAEALIARVRAEAETCASAALEALVARVATAIAGIAIRACPPLPATVAERLASYRAQNVADTVMFREALAGAAQARGWWVHWYEAKHALADAAGALGRTSVDDLVAAPGAAFGPPWRQDQRVAMAAATAAGAARGVARFGES